MAVVGTQTVNYETGDAQAAKIQQAWYPSGTTAAETVTVASGGGVSIYTKPA